MKFCFQDVSAIFLLKISFLFMPFYDTILVHDLYLDVAQILKFH